MKKVLVAAIAVLSIGLLVSPSASAESARAFDCAPPQPQGNGVLAVEVVTAGGPGCNVLRMIAYLRPVGPPTQRGFFHFFGPRGSIGDSQTKLWTMYESARIEVNQSAWSGSLWCAEFWMQTPPSFTRASEPVCGTI